MLRQSTRFVSRVRFSGLSGLRRYATTNDPKMVQVSLDDENPEVADFFSYTWGRWLVDDAKQRKLRETKFSLRGLSEVMKQSIGKSSPSDAELEIKTIIPHHEGKHHKIYKVETTDGRAYALRLPYSLGHDEFRQARMKSEVATIDYLRQAHELNTPEVLSWDSGKSNPLGFEYQLMPFVEGNLLMKQWNPASSDIQAKSATVQPLVEFMDKIVATKFNKFGSLYFTEDVDSQYQNDLPFEGAGDKYRIGPTTESRFWKGDSAQSGAAHRGPFSTVQEYLTASAQVQLAYIQEALAKGAGAPYPKALETFERFAKIVDNGLFVDPDPTLFSPRLHHPDLSPLNVVVSSDGTTKTLLDVEGTAIRPFALHGPPKFVQHKGPKIYTKEDVPDYDKLSEQDQKAVDHFITQTQNQFAYEYLFRQLATHQDLFPAFLPATKRRQQLIDTALNATAQTSQDLAYDQALLAQEWQYLGLEQPYPAPYTDAELEQVAKDTGEWNQHVMKNPFIETKGWLPAETFDQLVEQKVLVKDGDDYVYNG